MIAAIKPEFDEYGVAEDVLAELQEVRSSYPDSPLISPKIFSRIACFISEMGEQGHSISRC